MKIIIIVAAALLLAIVFTYIGVRAANKDAKEKGTTEKSYTVWSVLSGFLIGFIVLLYEIGREVFFPRRRKI